ncbi:MAG: ABC transporter permease [Bacteroidetes bacterium B1(2017)]|nr:MAG: ABC transporter permease [Bacteroidetes bacterium B1(2017)]
MNAIKNLIRKELLLEWRQRYALNGILLQVLSSVFVVYLAVKQLNNPTWNGVFWVVMLFISINAIAKSFIGEGKGRNLYYHMLVQPQQLLLAKFIYNALLNIVLASLCLATFSLLMGNPIQSLGLYIAVTILGCLGFASTFTMLSAIASKAGNSNLLMPVLSLPIIIPLLLIVIKAAMRSMDGLDSSLIYKDLGILFAFNILVITLAYILFPAVWKE